MCPMHSEHITAFAILTELSITQATQKADKNPKSLPKEGHAEV